MPDETPAQTFGPSSKKTSPIILILIFFLVVLVALAGYYFAAKGGLVKKPQVTRTTQTKQQATQSAQPVVFAGFTKAQELVTSYRGLVTQSRVQVNYVGTLKEIKDKSWTIEGNGKTITVVHESDGQIKYLRSQGKDSGSTQGIDASQLKVGDKAQIVTFIDPVSGDTSVNSIVLLAQ